MAFIASCQQEGTTVTEEPASGPHGQQEGTTVTEEPASGPHAYMNRPAPSPTR